MARGSSIDRGRGRGGRGLFYSGVAGYQRSGFMYDEEGRGAGRGDRTWSERNGTTPNDFDWNGTSTTGSPSPRKDFSALRPTSSGESWRRGRYDEDNPSTNLNGEGWRSSGSGSAHKWRMFDFEFWKRLNDNLTMFGYSL